MVTINAILLIWEPLKTNHEFKFLLTRRLNTDPFEKQFWFNMPTGRESVAKLSIATGHAMQIYNCLGQLRQL